MIQFLKKMPVRKFIDIGANLTDEMYKGVYHGSKKHEEDLNRVLQRCWNGGLEKIIVTSGSLTDAKNALELVQTDERLYTTVGCHPTRCDEFKGNSSDYINDLGKLIESATNKIVAVGECGLDYDRLHFCDKDTQKKYFEYQLQLCEAYDLPLFLHCRAAWDDFFDILKNNSSKLRGGVVHSFDGSKQHMEEAIAFGFYIGINGCSLKTEENLSVAKSIPTEKLLIETDCPWCEVRPSHAGAKYIKTQYTSTKKEKYNGDFLVKGRNEPANLIQVLEILSAIRGQDEDSLCAEILKNTNELFFRK